VKWDFQTECFSRVSRAAYRYEESVVTGSKY